MATDGNPTQKKKKSSEQLSDAYDNLIQTTETTGQELTDARVQAAQDNLNNLIQQDKDLTADEDAKRIELENVGKGGIDYISGLIDEHNTQQQKEQEEDKRLRTLENQRTAWTGAGELAANLINMFYVGQKNASNQQINNVSQDWMKKADADRKARRARMDDIKDRQRRLGEKKAMLESAKAKELFDYDQKVAAIRAERKAAIDKAKAELPLVGAEGRAEAATAAAELGVKQVTNVAEQRNTEDDNARGWSSIHLQEAKEGLVRDPKTGRYYKAPESDGGKSGSGSGSGSIIRIVIPGSDGKSIRLNIKKDSLYETLRANPDLLNNEDMSKAEKLLTGTLSSDEQTKLLMRYIKNSPDLLPLLQAASESVDELDMSDGDSVSQQEMDARKGKSTDDLLK